MLIGSPQISEKRERLYRSLMLRGGLASTPLGDCSEGTVKKVGWAPFVSANRVHTNSGTLTRPRYEYGYDAQGNQTLIRDPLGRETRFTFDAHGQQLTCTLPLGFGSDGILGTPDDPVVWTVPTEAPENALFTERTTFDARGRQHLHTSFEGIVSENVYDGYGRLSHINCYADQTAFDNETIAERWSYQYDSHGRKSAAFHSVNSGGTFTPDRLEETFYDDRGRVIAESTAEGVLGYAYGSQSRLASTAVFASGDDPFIDAPDRVTSYGYDILGRLISITEDSTPTNTSDDQQLRTDYTFDLAGRADTTTIADPSTGQSVTTDYDYDPLGRLDIQTDRDGTNNVLASYDYTVRADGKRTALDETHWFDTNEDGVVDPGELKTTTYDWDYDAIGRLTDEVIDHWDDTVDQTESFVYDLTGNRVQLDRDHGNDGVDQVITYGYDANDRLLEEVFDDLVNSANDTTTSYAYDHTQQIETMVTRSVSDKTVSRQQFSYNLQGRIATVTNEGYTGGTLSSRDRTSYQYDSKSYRAALVTEVDSALTNTYTLASSTEFLAGHHNHTGYVQTIRETTVNADGTSKTIDYTFGHNEISQRTVERNSGDTITSDETLVFGHDGHGSVRVLYDLAETTASVINQATTYAAYGAMLAVHNAAGALVGTSESTFKSNLGYSGEQWDASLRMQNLRARSYGPRNGRFIGIDPFAGNMQDPQSLHKYVYTHGNPISNTDPTGEFNLAGISITVGISGLLGGTVSYASGGNMFQGVAYGMAGGAVGYLAFPLALAAFGGGTTFAGFYGALASTGFVSGASVGGLQSWSENRSALDIIFDALESGVLGMGVSILFGPFFSGQYVARPGTVTNANFAQSSINRHETFSEAGRTIYSKAAGRPINTVNDLVGAIADGTVDASQLPVDFVVRARVPLILNTRTSTALNRAGVPRSQWYGRNLTGRRVPGLRATTFDELAEAQLRRNNLGPQGTPHPPY